MMKPHHLLWRLVGFISLFVLGIWLSFLFTPLVTDVQGLKYRVHEGASIRAVVDDLAAHQIIKNPFFFKILVRMKGVAHELKAGEYFFPKGTTPSKMIEQIISGSGMVYHSFMIVPGWTFKELKTALLRNNYLQHTSENLSQTDIMIRLGHPELKPEGEFFPDTYYFVEGVQDITILKRAFKAMQEKLQTAWTQRAANLPFKTAYEALIAASIIEKEAYFENEMPKIAGVMINRLKKGMLLQFDPTVIYGAGEHYKGKIQQSDLKSNNPYNTYKHKGLTPTPIAIPSLAAIMAVLHPAQHDYYYFVAKHDKSSLFTKQLSEHYQAVEMAKKTQGSFNYSLARYYLLQLFSHNI